MPHADMYTAVLRQHLQKTKNIVVVVQRLPHPHEHHGGHPDTIVRLSLLDLREHLAGQQVAHKAPHAGGAEGTAHPAPHLGGKALGPAVLVLHQHRLHRFAVRQTIQVFYSIVQGRYKLFFNFDTRNRKSL